MSGTPLMTFETEAISFDCGHTMVIEVKIHPTDSMDEIEAHVNVARSKRCLLCRRKEGPDESREDRPTT